MKILIKYYVIYSKNWIIGNIYYEYVQANCIKTWCPLITINQINIKIVDFIFVTLYNQA